MKKTFILENLDCANCAAKLERSLNKVDGVESAVVTFMTKKMILEAEDSKMDGIVEEAQRIIRKLEPQVVIRAR